MISHSDKGLKTLELMGTKPADWGLVEIKWVQEMRPMPVKKDCPTCSRTGHAPFEKDGTLAVNKISYEKDYYKWNTREQEMWRLEKRQCPTCPPRRNWGGYGTGYVTVWKPMKVWIGYPQWEEGSRFDSRFCDSMDTCDLCNKVIKKSGFVAVHGKDTYDKVHNMYVGEDCARKFLGITKKWKKDKTAFIKERS